jgi:hypothetical protein
MGASDPGGLGTFPVLVRHFFRRFFLNETMGFEEEMKLKLVAIGALVAGLSGFAANSLLFKYMFIPDAGQSWLEKAYFLGLLMILAAFLVLLEWDALFLDREDFQNLMPLPIRPRMLFWSKLSALILLVGLFTLIANGLAAPFFPVYLAQWQPGGLPFFVRMIAVHLLSSLAATVFTSLALAVLVGALMVILGPRLYRWASIVLRFLFLVVLSLILLSLVSDTLGVPRLLDFVKGLVERGSDRVFWLPPLWFTGIYERGLGNGDPLFEALAVHGWLALVAGVAGFWLVFAAGFRRQVVKAREAAARTPRLEAARSFLSRAFSAVILRNPVERAVFFFFGRTLARSARHKWMVASVMAVPTALVLVLLSWARARGGEDPAAVRGPLLAAPLIMTLFLLAGMRAMASSPIAAEANWAFRLTEGREARDYIVGLKKAVFFLGLVPLFTVDFVVAWMSWRSGAAFLHALFGLSVAGLLEHVFFFRFSKVPFACASLPGKERLQFLWFVYLGGFLVFISLAGRLEASLLADQRRFPAFFSVMAVLFLAIGLANRLFIYPRTKLVYEESPETTFVSLMISG